MATNIKYIYGKKACTCQIATVPMIEARLKKIGAIKKSLSGLITQGAYNSTVSASARTHVGGGVWDVSASLVDTEAKRRAWRESGAHATYRTRKQGNWRPHGHIVWIGCPHVSTGPGSAANQIAAFKLGRNGLASGGRDDSPIILPLVPWKTALDNFNHPKKKIPTVSLKWLLSNIKKGKKHVRIERVQKALAKLGLYTAKVDGVWGPATKTAYKKWQKSLYKNPASSDGIPGKDSLTLLGNKTKVFRAWQFK